MPIADLIPHAGAMVLLDTVLHWDATAIRCATRSHLAPLNPLRRAGGRLGAACGLEYALQAAALHGALRADAPQPPGYVARLRNVVLHVPFLDDPAFGTLQVEAILEGAETAGMLYALSVTAEHGTPLLTAGTTIALPRR